MNIKLSLRRGKSIKQVNVNRDAWGFLRKSLPGLSDSKRSIIAVKVFKESGCFNAKG